MSENTNLNESQNENQSENQSEKKLPTKLMLTMRVIVAGYLIYLAYGLKDSFVFPIVTKNIPVMIAAIVFAIAGLVIIFWAARAFLTGNYE